MHFPKIRAFILRSCILIVMLAADGFAQSAALELSGLTITPHFKLDSMRYQKEPEPAEGARVQMFLRNAQPDGSEPFKLNSDLRVLFNGKSPADLLTSGDWAWHDTPSATPELELSVPPGELVVWSFNGRRLPFGTGGEVAIEIGAEENILFSAPLKLSAPTEWIAAVTFLAPETAIQPDQLFIHVTNNADSPLDIVSARLWLPDSPKSPFVLRPQPLLENLQGFGGSLSILARDKGGFSVATTPLPLTYCAIEISARRPGGEPFPIWAHLRIKPERFDISGGWIGGSDKLTQDIFLKTLKRFHVNTGHIAHTDGYSDTELYDKYPIKYFNKLQPFERYDRDEILPRIHAAEFLGEPQYGGGTPVPPQDVWRDLRPYATTRIPTTLTHSEERVWRDYAGLSDYPHYDAYRVSAPSPDAWYRYERWGGKRIYWGGPLETIGDMCRSLRELNRPMPCAYWSQGPHHGWGVYGGRRRTSPTPDELRMQAHFALSERITSLYWFNLSLKSIVKWRDTLDELTRVGREIRMMDDLLLEGDAYRHQRILRSDGAPDWDIATVCGPRAALLFALDLDYAPDPDEKVFRFGPPRAAVWEFPLPSYLIGVVDVFRIDADGIYPVEWKKTASGIEISDTMSRVGIYVATPNAALRDIIEAKRKALIAAENELGFDPAHNDADFEMLKALAEAE